MNKYLIIFSLALIGFTSAQVPLSDKKHSRNDRVYLSLDQLFIDNNGIQVEINRTSHLIKGLYFDSRGYYFKKGELKNKNEIVFAEACPNGHPSTMNDGLCGYPGCPYNRFENRRSIR